jgi:PEP-CTERM motif
MNQKITAALVFVLAVGVAPRAAQAAPFVVSQAAFAADPVITFNGLPEGTTVTNQFAALGISFGGLLTTYDDQNVLFGGDTMQVLNSALPFNCGVAGNCLPFTFNFSTPVDRVGFFIATNPGTTTLSIAGGSLNFATAQGVTFVSIGNTIPFSTLTVAITGGVNGAAIFDEVRFHAVPEPATLLFVGTGLAAALRRRFGRR